MRVGLGFDVHAWDESRPLVLGGVTIPGHRGLGGHSDADVICHAVGDALLGAASLGDLGTHFPSDEEWRDASSLVILEKIARSVRGAGGEIGNIDVVLVAASPRIDNYRDEIQAKIATAVDIDRNAVSIKATTTDGLGFTGRDEGVAAIAVAMVRK